MGTSDSQCYANAVDHMEISLIHYMFNGGHQKMSTGITKIRINQYVYFTYVAAFMDLSIDSTIAVDDHLLTLLP